MLAGNTGKIRYTHGGHWKPRVTQNGKQNIKAWTWFEVVKTRPKAGHLTLN